MFETRQQGVRIPSDQTAKGNDEPNKIINVMPAEMLAVRYSNEYGKVMDVVVLKAGGRIYMPPNAEAWANALSGVKDWFFKGIKEKINIEGAPAPKEDMVDVVGSSIAKEVADGR
jgi:hypothetical protein